MLCAKLPMVNLLVLTQVPFKYFEPGQTFMAVDSFHKQVEYEMLKIKNLFVFEDFRKCIAGPGSTLEMTDEDFINHTSLS